MNARSVIPIVLLMSAIAAMAEPEIVGVGVVLIAGDHAEGPRIHKILPDSPAAKAKLKEGLIISKIDNKATAGKKLTDCVSLIRGVPGTTVVLELTDPTEGKKSYAILARAKLEIEATPGAVNPEAAPR